MQGKQIKNRRFWLDSDDFKIRCSEYGFDLSEPIADILIIPGLGEFIERYDNIAYKFVEKNIRACVLDLPGQGLSSRFGNPKTVIHVDDFNIYNKSINLISSSLKLGKKRPVIFMGHSLGGFLCLNYQLNTHNRRNNLLEPSLTICMAPMMGLPLTSTIALIINIITKILKFFKYSNIGISSNLASISSYLGLAGKSVTESVSSASSYWKKDENIKYFGSKKANQALTHYINNIELDTEGPSWQWVSNAISETKRLSDNDLLKKIKNPTLMIIAKDEFVTDPKAQWKAVHELRFSEVLELQSCRHDILHEKDEIQRLFWKGIDQFLEKNNFMSKTVPS